MAQTELERTSASPQPSRFERWHGRVLGFCLIIFALEIGLFLVIFPWTLWWELNWIPAHSPQWSALWMSKYFRGAISGLGFLNFYVAFGEFLRQLHSLWGPPKA